jgi:hypothetical protein
MSIYREACNTEMGKTFSTAPRPIGKRPSSFEIKVIDAELKSIVTHPALCTPGKASFSARQRV